MLYAPGEDSDKVLGQVTIRAFVRSSVEFIANKVFLDEPFRGSFKIKNLSKLDFSLAGRDAQHTKKV